MDPDSEALYRDEPRKPRVCGPTRASCVASLDIVAAPTDSEFDACQICQVSWTDTPAEVIVDTGCPRHGNFHRTCLVTWFNHAGTCPYCRKLLFVDCCAKISPFIPFTHVDEDQHVLSLADLFGHPASDYSAVLAVLTFDDNFDGAEVSDVRVDITPGQDIELHQHLEGLEPFLLTITSGLILRLKDHPDSSIAFIQYRPGVDPPESIRILCAWGILLLVFRRDEDDESDIEIIDSEQGLAEDRMLNYKHEEERDQSD